jgi:hypothetical protein
MTKVLHTCIFLLMVALAACQSDVQSQVESEPAAAQDTVAPEESSLPKNTSTNIPIEPENPSPEPIPVMSLQLEIIDSDWDGERIPEGQQCQRQGGKNPSTPSILVGDIPEGTEALILEFSDRDFGPMDDGGHGKVGFVITEGASETMIPPLPGHTFDLPQDFFLVQEHLAPGFDTPGAYMPPCSGGASHSYYVTVKAVELVSIDELSFNVLGQGILELGEY